MRASVWVFGAVALAFASQARAYEYRLQFTPNSGARGLMVAGYTFSGKTVVGDCSYYTVQSGSGRGGGYHTTTTYYNQTCTWDLYGNLLGIVSGAPVQPAPLYVSGTQTVYAKTKKGYTGSDSAYGVGGFVFTTGSHYTWTTSSAYMVIPQQLHTFTATLQSDGDKPLTVAGFHASAVNGAVTVNSNTCAGEIAAGSSCSVTVTYDPSKLTSPNGSGYGYDTLTISPVTNAGQVFEFIQGYTVILTAPPPDDG